MRVEPPSTPLMMNADSDFGDDVDEDASPLEGKDRGLGADEIEQLAEAEQSNAVTASPRTLQSSVSKPVSPEALTVSAGISEDDVIEVFEES